MSFTIENSNKTRAQSHINSVGIDINEARQRKSKVHETFQEKSW